MPAPDMPLFARSQFSGLSLYIGHANPQSQPDVLLKEADGEGKYLELLSVQCHNRDEANGETYGSDGEDNCGK
ncbi:MAG: hypothetical protein Q9174_002954 [Haloplaca sp. 1 TL-2023]